MQEILVENLMSREVPVLPQTGTLEQVVRKMSAESVSSVILLGSDGRPAGIITEADIIRLATTVLDGKLDWSAPAAEHMSTTLSCVRPEQSLSEALLVAREHRVRHLPVLGADAQVVGMVTVTDMARAHFSIYESQRENVERRRRGEDLATVTARLRTLSLEDPLLRIGNRRALERDLAHIEETSRRYQHDYSVALFDVDRFKAYNDNYGHPAGDRVLKQVVAEFAGSLRSADRLYRYGGEEILLLMPETDLDGAMVVAERLRAALEQAAIPHAKARRGVVTVSGGVAQGGFRHEPEDWESVVQAADQALYRAKKSGRNKVTRDRGPAAR